MNNLKYLPQTPPYSVSEDLADVQYIRGMVHHRLEPLHVRHDPSAIDELPDEELDARGAGQVGEGAHLGLGQ